MFCKKRRNFTKFTGKHLCQSLSFNKVAGLRHATLLKKSLWHRCFSVNFAKFLRRLFLQNTFGRLLLAKKGFIMIAITIRIIIIINILPLRKRLMFRRFHCIYHLHDLYECENHLFY